MDLNQRMRIAEEVISMHIFSEGQSRQETGANLSATFALALFILFPERGKNGQWITETIAAQLVKYPNPFDATPENVPYAGEGDVQAS